MSYDPHYASDGEVVLARIVVISRVTHDGVQVLFEYEGGERGRGWVFHSAQLDEEETSLDWVEYAEDVPDPRALQHEDETGTEDYWAGFTPPVPMAEIRIGSATEAEEDYWAQYDVAGTIETPAGEINQAHAADAGQAKQHSSSAQIKVSSNDSILSQKLVSKITTLLRQAWSEFSEDARGQEDELEKKALDWLRVSRNVVQGDPRAGRMEEGEMLMRTKVDILWDMYGILYVDGEESRDGYWRLVEEAIRLPRGKETSEGETQPLYLQ